MSDAAVVAEGLRRTYGSGEVAIDALVDLDLVIESGQFVVLIGPSGSGKTTLLNLVGAIDVPTSGRLEVDGVRLDGLDGEARTRFRREHVGFVFQFFNLIPTLTALENVQLIAEMTGHDGERLAWEALDAVDVADRADHFPAALSGGEQQRVAIARAVAKRPRLLLADEPTGSLDLETGRLVLDVIRRLNRARGMTVLLVTHNTAIAEMADRVIRLRDGRVVSDVANPTPVSADRLEW